MVSLILCLANNIAPPQKHGCQHQRKTQPKNSHTVGHFVHIHHAANSGSKGRGRSNSWPWASFNQMIGVFICTAHFSLLTIWPLGYKLATSPRLLISCQRWKECIGQSDILYIDNMFISHNFRVDKKPYGHINRFPGL